MDWLVREVSASFTGNRYPVHIGWLIVQVLCASLFWLFMYAALCLSMPRFRCEWHCRMVTAVHALIVSALAFLDVFIIGRIPFYHKNQGTPATFVMTAGRNTAWVLADSRLQLASTNQLAPQNQPSDADDDDEDAVPTSNADVPPDDQQQAQLRRSLRDRRPPERFTP
uniref:Transmembrane protein n=1 Tax=Macrostomum lignano TaxID=282301 RepID=A0A1I8J332_9PLAT